MFLKTEDSKINEFVLYAYTFRSRAERVLWALREFDCSYEVVRLDPFKNETIPEEILSLNSATKVPVLVHGDDILTESLAIMEYLNDISESHKLIPTDPKKAFSYRKLVHYGLTEIEPYLWIAEQASRLKMLYCWPDGTYEGAINQVKQNIKVVWQWAEAERYIAGSKFSLADIYFYHLVTWANQYKIKYSSSVGEYLQSLEERSAFPAEMLSN